MHASRLKHGCVEASRGPPARSYRPRRGEAIMAINLVNLKLVRPGGRPAVIHSGRRR
ncbi:hypothetical protein DF3PB_4520002 [uncultured Defluviicoccus sp.]|uniref:Uncharacterized protein n=1 Tax=metagenome TaxID=256318 RepID=A0A380TGE9_9ZZZZ|nr:hypothetical protein DF3PB_4520002 [uncultured Defluviicoccus sp.]